MSNNETNNLLASAIRLFRISITEINQDDSAGIQILFDIPQKAPKVPIDGQKTDLNVYIIHSKCLELQLNETISIECCCRF